MEDTRTAGPGGARPVILTFLLTSLLWIVAGGALLFFWRQPEPAAFAVSPPPATATPIPTATATATPTPAPLLVDVDGAVRLPGVYRMAAGSRVQDAIALAGGLAPNADARTVSLARPLQDGEKVYVPQAGETAPPLAVSNASRSETLSLDLEAEVGFPININTATATELESLPGIGPKTAQAIVDYRDANGPFPSVESITEVKGIGEGTLEKIRELISVN